MINTILTFGAATTFISAAFFIVGLGFWSPALTILQRDWLYMATFVIGAVVFTLSNLLDATFVATRKAGFVLTKSMVFGVLRLFLPLLLLLFFHSFGIFASWSVALVGAFLFGILLLLPRAQSGFQLFPAFNRNVMGKIFRFSFANYLSGIVGGSYTVILPLIVVNVLGAEANAYFYMASAINGILTMIPVAVSTSLFAEGSHEREHLESNAWRSLKMVFIILVPAVILILVFAGKVLLVFGPSYSKNASLLLRIMSISAIPAAINLVYLGIKKVEKKLNVIVFVCAFIAVVSLGLSYALLSRMGINGIGVALLVAHGLVALWISFEFFIKRLRISKL